MLKRRRFALDALPDATQAQALSDQGHVLMGVEAVAVQGSKVTVTYDLLQASAGQIEAQIEAAGAQLSSGRAERLRRRFIRYMEECEIAHLQVGPPSRCHRTRGGRNCRSSI